MRALLIAVVAVLAAAAPAAAAPTWLPPKNLATGLPEQPSADVAVAPDGTAVAVWIGRVGGANLLRGQVRLPGQDFGPVRTLTPADGRNASGRPTAAVDAGGNVTVAWTEELGPGGVRAVRAARRPAGSTDFEAPRTVSNPAAPSHSPAIAVGAGGTTVVAFKEGVGTQKVRAAVRDGAGSDFAAVDVSESFAETFETPAAGVDDDGDAVVAWQQPAGGRKVIQANQRPRGGGFASVVTGVRTLSNSVLDAERPVVAMAPGGTTVVLWSQTTTNDVRYNERTPGGEWLSDAKTASPPGVGATAPQVAMDGAGNAVAVWLATSGPATFLQAGLRPAGGAFGGDFRDLTSSGAFNHDVSVNRSGDAVVTFSGAMAETIGSVRRPRGGGFTGVIPAENRATSSTALFNAGVGVDDEGNATGIWTRNVDPAGANTYEVAAAALDAAPPTLTAVAVPASARIGAQLRMTAAAVDRLSGASLSWNFGDGATASGGAVAHAFGRAGAFGVTVTATDGVGNAASATRSVLVGRRGNRRIDSSVGTRWGFNRRFVFLLRMRVNAPPRGSTAVLRCKGRKCPFKRRKVTRIRRNAITIFKSVKASRVAGKRQRRFRPKQTLTLRITAPGRIGKVVRYRIKSRKIPVGKVLCLPEGAKKPRKRC